jgi:putative tricarboxylic transport membrane protein
VLRQVGRGGAAPIRTRFREMLIGRRDLARTTKASIRGGLLGFGLGALPGAGATLASFFSYELERRVSKQPDELGTGVIEGVSGPEGANNAATNGSFVPLLTLGIPGSGTTAILLGAFLLFGIRPGPLLMVEQADIAWGLMASFWIGNLLLLGLNLPLAPAFASVLRIPYRFLYPNILLLCLIGAFAIENRMWGVWLALAFGLIGYLMNRYGYPPAPLILGLVLGPEMESQLARSLSITQQSHRVAINTLSSLGVIHSRCFPGGERDRFSEAFLVLRAHDVGRHRLGGMAYMGAGLTVTVQPPP